MAGQAHRHADGDTHGAGAGVHVHDLHGLQRRVLLAALAANALLLVGEAVAGWLFDSLALLADAAHQFADVAGLTVALGAQLLVVRPHSERHTFGLLRAEALGAQINGVLLVGSAVWISVEALRRIGEPHDIAGAGVAAVATVGLMVNLVSALALARVRGRDLNVQGAVVHMRADALGSVGALLAGLAVVLWDATWVDPAVSLLIAGLVLVAAWRLLGATTHLLLDGSPRHLDATEVAATIAGMPAVEDVHHLHLWSLSSAVTALSAHVVLRGEVALHEAQERGDEIRAALADRFGIGHTTLELECHGCEDAIVSGSAPTVATRRTPGRP